MDVVAPQFLDIDEVELIHDDGTIAGFSQEDHDEAVYRFLDRCVELGLTLNPKKCIFSAPSIPFWGCIISNEGIKPNPLKVKTLQQTTRPDTKEELISFLAMVRSNSDFIPSLAKHTVNLRALTKKGVHFDWKEVHETEFTLLKDRFNEAVLLKYFDPSLPTFIHVDGSPDGFGAILCQGDSVEKATPVTVASRSTTPAESRYPQIDREAMAINFCFTTFSCISSRRTNSCCINRSQLSSSCF